MNNKQLEGYLKGLDFALSIMKTTLTNEEKVGLIEKVIDDHKKDKEETV